MGMVANVRIIDTAERRESSRLSVDSDSTLRTEGNAIDVVVLDLSETGCAIETPCAIAVGSIISIGIGGFGTFDAKVVRKADDMLGCAFLQPINSHVVRQAFASTTVTPADGLATLPAVPNNMSEGDLKPWPLGYRAIFVAGSSAMLWALTVTAVYLVFRML